MWGTAGFLELFALETIEEASDLKLAHCSAILLLPNNPWEPVAFIRNTKENVIRPAIALHQAGLSWSYFSMGEIFERAMLTGGRERTDKNQETENPLSREAYLLPSAKWCCMPLF